MFMEYIPEKHTPAHWVVCFAVEDRPQLFEKGNAGIEFVVPVSVWLKNQAANSSFKIFGTDWARKETQVQITFYKKTEAEHFLARFYHG
jgi:hypothetical protein